MSRPSAPLVSLLRELAGKKGLNTAALAKAAGIDRARLKHVLAMSEPMTVDELIALSEALEVSPQDMASLPERATAKGAEPPKPSPLTAPDPHEPVTVDPFGNQAEQALRLGFAMGVDLFLVFDAAQIQTSGVPKTVLAHYTDNLPIKLDAAFHRHNDPKFLPDGIELRLSFDAIHTCTFPWSAIKQVTLFPLPPEPAREDETKPAPRGHLRLVD